MDATETPAVPSSTTPAAPLTSQGGFVVNKTMTVCTVIAFGAIFGLVTKYGLKKSNGWIIGAAATGLVVGFFADAAIQPKLQG